MMPSCKPDKAERKLKQLARFSICYSLILLWCSLLFITFLHKESKPVRNPPPNILFARDPLKLDPISLEGQIDDASINGISRDAPVIDKILRNITDAGNKVKINTVLSVRRIDTPFPHIRAEIFRSYKSF